MYLPIKRAVMALCMSLFCIFAFAQKTITGTVKDAAGDPLIGATVSLGGNNGVITDIDGNFTLPGVNNGATLTVSYIGYETTTVKVGNQQHYDIVLESNDKSLDEVVVIGYGTVKRRDLTGAVASVTGERLAKNPVANVAQALQGQLPGVNVISQDGRPGATMSIRVRGGGSITQSNEPLYVVDGVITGRIDDIPADDIESIDVLKDAASTAIYGASGANGVILITTKSAKEGKNEVKYNMYYQLKEQPEQLDVLDPYDYVLHTWSYATAYGESYGDNVAKYFGLGSKYGNHLNEYKNMSTHNWVDDIMDSSHSWNHDLSLSGGSSTTKYRASVNYMNDDGARLNTGFRRWNASFKFSQDISKKLKWDLDARYSEMRFRGTRFNTATSAYQFRPVDNPLGADADPSQMGQGSSFVELSRNPLDYTKNYDQYNDINRLRVNTGLTWTIINGLVAKSEIGLSRGWTERRAWDGGHGDQGYSSAQLYKSNSYNVRWSNTLNYNVQGLGEGHSLGMLAGYEILADKTNYSNIYGYGYPSEFTMNDAFGMINFTGKTKGSEGLDKFENVIGEPKHVTSFFGRVNYSYLGRYLLTATFRADGSSRFASNNTWGYFPAAAAAWRISDEPFMEGARDWLDNLKIRLSFGTSGNDNIDAGLWRETWTTSTINVDGVNKVVYIPGSMKGNPDLKWETTVSRNLGFDFGILRGKLRGSLDLYWNTTKDILMKVPIDEATGYSYQYQNVGQTSNRGVELALFYEAVRSKDFGLSFNLTYNYNNNMVDKLNPDIDLNPDTHTGWGSSMRKPYYDYIIRVGEPVGTIQGFKSNGFYTLDDFNYSNGVYTLKDGVPDTKSIVNYPANAFKGNKPDGQTAFPGMVKFEDVNGDGVIDDSDATVIGKTQPHHTGGLNIMGNYKNLDFSLGFTYQIGGKVYNANVMHDMMGDKDNSLGANRLDVVKDCFRIYDVGSDGNLVAVTEPEALRALNANAKYALPYSEYGLASSEFIEDASYLRLNTLTVGYTLPKAWLNTVGIKNVRVYFTGANLFCITGYSGLDPDVNTNMNAGGDGFPTPFYDYQAYPKTRSYTFGLNVTF
ncbi:MAG: TonB-dependent receptor [Prevotella sp.]|nr:TonB-dependent receptor [Prevotella sp.]